MPASAMIQELFRDWEYDFLMSRIRAQETAIEEWAISGCFIEDMQLVISVLPYRWRIGVGTPIWRNKFIENDAPRAS